MEQRSSLSILNTVLLALILIALGALLIGGVTAVNRLRQFMESLKGPGEAIQEIKELVNPTPTVVIEPITIVRQVNALSRLETASYTVEKIITAESGQGAFSFLFGDRLILVAHGQVIAGVDLSKLQEEDITVSVDGTVTVKLPPAEVLVVALDNQQSYIYDRETGIVGMNPALETEARRAAEQEILNAALEDGILEMAQRNAEAYLRQLILTLGFKQVVFIR
ncbi:MAG: DUF4230 domain-containing protein [Anaerolineae bacterium]|nr:DUF4230 domain-containing protein [Anaerolineae bacterium]